jgi:ATP-binding protein involved in chromosome partitioning
MSYFVCPHCGERTEIFSHGGAPRQAMRLKVPYLGEVPLETEIRVGGDEGYPVIVAKPQSPVAAAFRAIAGQLAAQVSTRPKPDWRKSVRGCGALVGEPRRVIKSGDS